MTLIYMIKLYHIILKKLVHKRKRSDLMLYALVVIYNKKCIDSKTLNNLLKYKEKIKIVIYDNSTKDFENEEFCKQEKIMYYTKRKNVGLSKAYNYVISQIKYDKEDYIIILDDDTELNDEYFSEVFSKVKNTQADILLPIVKSNNQIISPSLIQFGCRVIQLQDLNCIDINKITAINSGMVIKMKVFESTKYCEKIFLDYVDHYFMKEIREKQYNIKVMDSCIMQNFSRNEKQSIESVRFRFNIYKKDFKKYCDMCGHHLYYYININKLRLVYFLKYKKIFF